jgi:DHA3 family macrolide efflux protein-like MFS transporter
VQYAIIWYVTFLTGEGSSLALITICNALPQAIVTPFGGVLADRHNRKILIQTADCTVALTTLLLALFLIFQSQSLTAIYICSIIRSIGSGIQIPTVNALIPQIAEKDKLMEINSIFTTMFSILGCVAPAIAGIILKYSRFQYVLFIDVVTALIGVTIFAFVKVPYHEKAKALIIAKKRLKRAKKRGKPLPQSDALSKNPLQDLKEGLKFAWNTPFVRGFLFITAIFCLIIPIPSVLNILLITRVFGEDPLYLTINEIAYFAGGGFGGFLFAKWGGFKNRTKSLMLGYIIFGVTTIGIALTTNFPLYIAIIAVCGLSMPLCNAVPMTMLQENVKDENILGRMFSINNIISSATMPLGIAVYGPLADVFDIRDIMLIAGIALCALALVARNTKSVYNVNNS